MVDRGIEVFALQNLRREEPELEHGTFQLAFQARCAKVRLLPGDLHELVRILF
jgi:hypothetical protein